VDFNKFSRLANPADFPGVEFGKNIILYGNVKIGKGTRICDNIILGIPSSEVILDSSTDESDFSQTQIGSDSFIGPFSVIHNGAEIASRVHIEAYSRVGEESKIGRESRIIYGAQIYYHVSIGKRSIVGGFCCDRSKIGNKVVMFGKLIHKFSLDLIKRYRHDPIRIFDSGVDEPSPIIGDHVIVGFDAIIIGGVRLSAFSHIAAGAIVSRNVKGWTLVKGVNEFVPLK